MKTKKELKKAVLTNDALDKKTGITVLSEKETKETSGGMSFGQIAAVVGTAVINPFVSITLYHLFKNENSQNAVPGK